MKVRAIVLAGGSGQRFQGRKQFELLNGKYMWQHPYEKICDLLDKENVVVVGVDIPGGESRTQSVINGMKALSRDTDRVIIIEAARPLVTTEQLRVLIEATHPSVSYVRPLVNTVIYRTGEYINRSELYDLLTPQAFDYTLLLDALLSGKYVDETDDTRIIYKHYGIKPHFIETTGNLMKVTYPEDIYIVEQLFKRQTEDLGKPR